MTAPVTVLVPVYKGLADVQACLESVVRHGAEAPFELLVIDDASPQADGLRVRRPLRRERARRAGQGAAQPARTSASSEP